MQQVFVEAFHYKLHSKSIGSDIFTKINEKIPYICSQFKLRI